MKITTLEEAEEKGFRTYRYPNGDWSYIDADGNYHLFRDGVELTEGVVANGCWSYSNRDWEYEDINGEVHLIKSPKDIKPEPATTEYKARVKTKDDEVIEDLSLTLCSAQEYFNVDLMPEIMAIANKISKRKDK